MTPEERRERLHKVEMILLDLAQRAQANSQFVPFDLETFADRIEALYREGKETDATTE